MAYCLSMLSITTEKGLRKLVDHLPFYVHALAEGSVFKSFQSILDRARKGGKLSTEAKEVLTQLEGKITLAHERSCGVEHPDGEGEEEDATMLQAEGATSPSKEAAARLAQLHLGEGQENAAGTARLKRTRGKVPAPKPSKMQVAATPRGVNRRAKRVLQPRNGEWDNQDDEEDEPDALSSDEDEDEDEEEGDNEDLEKAMSKGKHATWTNKSPAASKAPGRGAAPPAPPSKLRLYREDSSADDDDEGEDGEQEEASGEEEVPMPSKSSRRRSGPVRRVSRGSGAAPVPRASRSRA
jgi:hypothetical protein